MRQKSTARRRGAVLAEYALLLTFFAVPVIGGITAMGVHLLKDYRTTRQVILAPFP